MQQKGIPKNCRNAKISGRCPIFPKPNASHFYSVKRSSVFYAKIGPRLSPKLFAMRDFLTACELCSELSAATLPRKIVCNAGFLAACELYSGIIGRHAPPKDYLPCGIPCGVWIAFGDYPPLPRRLFAVRDSLRRVNCIRGLSAATFRKIVCRAGFLAACGLLSGIIGRHAPPKIVCNAGFFAACGLQSGIIRRARKFRRKTLFLQHGRRGKGCFTPAAAAVRTPNRVFHGCTMHKFSFRALSLQYTERH